jgi:hypothetical protein
MGYGGQRSRVKEYVQGWRAKPELKTPKPRRRAFPNLKSIAFWQPNQRLNAIRRATMGGRGNSGASAGRDESGIGLPVPPSFQRPRLRRAAIMAHPDVGFWYPGAKALRDRRDYDAVVAAVERPWSNGQVDGQVHRIKFLKRQMYGRSGFLLLWRRVLPFAVTCVESSP